MADEPEGKADPSPATEESTAAEPSPSRPSPAESPLIGDVERELEALASRRLRLALALTAAMLVTYFGFIGLVAVAKEALGTLLTDGLSLGILLGALVIVIAWVLTGVYVRWANQHYDTALERLRARKKANP